MRSLTSSLPLAVALTVGFATLWARPVSAHWCHDLWGTSYNIAVRPASDTVSIPGSGSASLDVWVQNNMGYPLKNFTLRASISGGYSVDVVRHTPVVENYLMPSEKLRYTLTISGGGGEVSAGEIQYFVSFGDGGQSSEYGEYGHSVTKLNDGSTSPASPSGLGEGWGQALHLRYSALADWGDLDTALDGLLEEYCAGRRSWDHNNEGVIRTYCADSSSTTCSGNGVSTPTKWDWQKLWAAQELAIRKAHLEARLATLRERLQCAWDDPHLTFKTMAGFVLGYLGDDSGARSFLENIVSNGSADERDIAKAALLMMGDTSHHADVVSCTSSPTFQVAQACAAALGIVDRDDDAVESVLLAQARWVCPGGCDGAGDDGYGYLAAHLLSIVAWDRRGWQPGAGETGVVTFYGEEGDEPPPPPTNNAPDCSGATVSPTFGDVPLSITMDASNCTDSDGDTLTYLWRVPTSITTEETYEAAIATHEIPEAGNISVRLTVTDNAESPLSATREFPINAGGDEPPIDAGIPGSDAGRGGGVDDTAIVGSCGCRTGTARWPGRSAALFLFALLGASLRRRKR